MGRCEMCNKPGGRHHARSSRESRDSCFQLPDLLREGQRVTPGHRPKDRSSGGIPSDARGYFFDPDVDGCAREVVRRYGGLVVVRSAWYVVVCSCVSFLSCSADPSACRPDLSFLRYQSTAVFVSGWAAWHWSWVGSLLELVAAGSLVLAAIAAHSRHVLIERRCASACVRHSGCRASNSQWRIETISYSADDILVVRVDPSRELVVWSGSHMNAWFVQQLPDFRAVIIAMSRFVANAIVLHCIFMQTLCSFRIPPCISVPTLSSFL